MKPFCYILLGVLATLALTAASEHPLHQVHTPDLQKRIERYSALFLGRPYTHDGGLGEGEQGEFDRNPQSRFDAFHCVSYLETVIALAISQTPLEYDQNLRRIRYRNGHVSFVDRNHFPCLDWIPNNLKNGVLEDITQKVAGDHPLLIAKAKVDRRGWFEFLPKERIVLPGADEETRTKAWEKLKAHGKRYKPVIATLAYIPFETLFPQRPTDKHKEIVVKDRDPSSPELPELDTQAPADEAIFHRIPSGTVVNIVRPNWNVLKVIGSRMNVSHQGFLIWKGDVLMLRHAKSEVSKKVVDEPFIDYLRRAMTRKSIHGIHLMQVRAPAFTRKP